MANHNLKVYFDGQCPLCKREINFYRGLKTNSEITWIDIEEESFDQSQTGISKDKLKRRFHVEKDNTEVFSGGYAFLELWKHVCVSSQIAKILDNYFIPRLLDKLYDFFLVIRPLFQKLLIRLENKKKPN